MIIATCLAYCINGTLSNSDEFMYSLVPGSSPAFCHVLYKKRGENLDDFSLVFCTVCDKKLGRSLGMRLFMCIMVEFGQLTVSPRLCIPDAAIQIMVLE